MDFRKFLEKLNGKYFRINEEEISRFQDFLKDYLLRVSTEILSLSACKFFVVSLDFAFPILQFLKQYYYGTTVASNKIIKQIAHRRKL